MKNSGKSFKNKKKRQEGFFNRLVAWLHLWPSIVSGLIVVFVCLTGTIIVYGDEIMDFSAGSARYVKVGTHRISEAHIKASLQQNYPDDAVSEYVIFRDPNRSIRIRTFNPKQKRLALIYMDPYTGEILKRDISIYFFFVMAHLHSSLLAGTVGGWIVAIATIIFAISCVTGLVLWWPKRWNKATRKASFTIRWRARFKRLNYDLHNVFGFYSLIVSLILGLTGLLIFFPNLMNPVIASTGGNLAHLEEVLPSANPDKTPKDMVAFAYQVLHYKQPEKEMVSIWNYDKQSLGAFVFTAGKAGLKSVENADITIYDRYSGQEIQVAKSYLQHEKTENMIWQLHMGQWWGQFGKLSTFLAGLIATTLPVTGFLIWWGRRKKKQVNTT